MELAVFGAERAPGVTLVSWRASRPRHPARPAAWRRDAECDGR